MRSTGRRVSPKNSSLPKARLSVGFILAPRFTICAFANFIDVLRLAADEGDRSRPILCEWSVLSATMHSVTSSSGVDVQPSERLGDPARFDYIVVVGGLLDEIENLNPEYAQYLKLAAEKRVPLVGVCTGAFILYRTGLMSGYRCCVSWFHHNDFLEQFEGLLPVSDRIYLVDRDRLTCSGGVGSAHLAAFLVERHVGRAPAIKSLNIMIIDDAKAGENPQPAFPLLFDSDDEVVKRSILLMWQAIDVPLRIKELAQRLGISARQLERRFRNYLGRSPAAVYQELRLHHAIWLLESTEKAVSTIAVAAGYCDSSHFNRVFKSVHKLTPSQWRRRLEIPSARLLEELPTERRSRRKTRRGAVKQK